ncbi:hypothetical protein OROMI_019443 [Orobanche minor]
MVLVREKELMDWDRPSYGVMSEIQERRTAPIKATKGATHSSVKTKPLSTKKVLDDNNVEIVPNKKTKNTMGNTDIHIAPPKIVTEENGESSEVVIGTQQRQVTSESWMIPTPIHNVQGPTMYQQLLIGKPPSQPRINFRVPPMSTDGHFTLGAKATIRQDASKKIIFANG